MNDKKRREIAEKQWGYMQAFDKSFVIFGQKPLGGAKSMSKIKKGDQWPPLVACKWEIPLNDGIAPNIFLLGNTLKAQITLSAQQEAAMASGLARNTKPMLRI